MDFVIHDLKLNPVEGFNFNGDPNGHLLTFKEPQKDRNYFMGVDIGSGQGLSNSVIHVLEEGTLAGPDEMVAEFSSDFLDPHEMAPVINLVGNIYWCSESELPAMACIEMNNYGEGTNYDLMTYYGYTNIFQWKVYDRNGNIVTNKLGWYTTPRSRKKLVLWGVHQLKRKQWIINSPWMIDEMTDFETERALSNTMMDAEAIAIARHGTGARDDRIMAGFIAQWCCHDVRGNLIDPAIERAHYEEEARRRREEAAVAGGRKDFQNTAITYNEMMEQWEQF